MSRFRLRFLSLVLAFGAVSAATADLTHSPTPWSSFSPPGWTPHLINGGPVRDMEGVGSCNDTTNGGSAFAGATDLASGGCAIVSADCVPYNVVNCNPNVPPGTCCGDKTTAFTAYFNGGNDVDISNDYFALRMRVNGDPRNDGDNCLNNSHWNFLLDAHFVLEPSGDNFKEWWIDVHGNDDRVRILYENNQSMTVDGDASAGAPYPLQCTNPLNSAVTTRTLINELTSCAVLDSPDTGITCGTGGGVRDCTFSHTRVCGVQSSQANVADCQTTTNSTLEWYIDVQIPINLLRDNCSPAVGPPTNTLGNVLLAFPPTAGFFFSTSDSSTDPLQKDFIATCQNVPTGPCDFGGSVAVTLSYFRAVPTGSGMRFEWSTESESGNVGFHILAAEGSEYRVISPRPIASKNPFSLSRLDYSVEIPGAKGTRFAIDDIDLAGKTRRHGAFEAEREYGGRLPVDLRDWNAIRAEHEASELARLRGEVSRARGLATVPTPLRGADVRVDREGIQRVTYEQVIAAGLPWQGVQSARIALLAENGPVPIRVVGGPVFGPGSYIEFVGTRATGVYTRTNVYRLKLDPGAAQRVPEVAGVAKSPAASYLATAGADDALAWSFSAPGSDPWYRDWVVVWSGTPVERSYTIDLDRLADGAGATLRASIWGMTDWASGEDHHVQLWLNGTLIADRRFDGLQELAVAEPIPAGLLRPGANTLTVRAPADNGEQFEVLAVDKFSIDYRRGFGARDRALDFSAPPARYAVDGFRTPNVAVYQVQGASVAYIANAQARREPFGDYRVTFASPAGAGASRYYVAEAATIAAPQVRPWYAAPEILAGGEAEYLVISHPDFVAGLGGLVAARQAEGLSVKVVNVEKIYSELGHGIFGPEAIRDYIRYAAANFGTRYVLLVGADSYDYLNQLGLGSISFVPTLYAETGPVVRWAPADALFGDLDDDMVPEVAVGRLPVHGAAELAAIVDKTLAYPTAGHATTAIFAADETDLTGNFGAMSDDAASRLGAGWNVNRIYLDEMEVGDAREALMEGLDAGVAYTQYLGHSGTSLWSFSNLFTAADAASLANAGKPTIVGQWGCWNTFYVTPDASSMADKLLLEGDRGAAAVFGSSALMDIDSGRLMSQLMADELARGATIGEALIAAKSQIAISSPFMIDVIRSFNLLGDPALRIQP